MWPHHHALHLGLGHHCEGMGLSGYRSLVLSPDDGATVVVHVTVASSQEWGGSVCDPLPGSPDHPAAPIAEEKERMKVYLASRLRNRTRCRDYRDALEAAGIACTSRWLDHHGGTPAEIAERDLVDVRRADTLVLIGHVGRNGGMATELGVAIERGIRIIHVAAERGENVFTHTGDVEYYRTFREALEVLAARKVA